MEGVGCWVGCISGCDGVVSMWLHVVVCGAVIWELLRASCGAQLVFSICAAGRSYVSRWVSAGVLGRVEIDEGGSIFDLPHAFVCDGFVR